MNDEIISKVDTIVGLLIVLAILLVVYITQKEKRYYLLDLLNDLGISEVTAKFVYAEWMRYERMEICKAEAIRRIEQCILLVSKVEPNSLREELWKVTEW